MSDKNEKNINPSGEETENRNSVKDASVSNDQKTDENDSNFTYVNIPRYTSVSTRIPQKAASKLTESEYYDTTHKKRGVAIIFNHYYFKGQATRSGTNEDCERLARVLRHFQFEVRVYKDLTYNEIVSVLKSAAAEDHTENDCILVAVMSHGDDGVLYAMDKSYPVSELWYGFTGDNCKSLIGKPKLFLIQACRGTLFDKGVDYKTGGKDFVDAVEEEPVTYRIPQMADLLVMYSTFEGHYSWRNPTVGSWFIQAFCEEMILNGGSRDLLLLLTGVNRRVAYSYQSNVPGKLLMDCMKQMPCITSMLTKSFYFTKK